jgi:hypothetical protein
MFTLGVGKMEYGRDCPACGYVNRQSARFCRECGNSLEPSPLQASSEQGTVPEPGTDTSAEPRRPGTAATWTQPAHAVRPLPTASAAAPTHQRRSRSRWRPVAVPLALLVTAGTLALVGWQEGWPPAVFGPRQVSSAAPLPGSPTRPPGPSHPAAESAAPTPSPTPSPTQSPTPSPSATPSPTPSPGSPAATLDAYFAAINNKDYATAWQLGGRNAGGTYSDFVNGFATTARDTVTILSVSGNTVTATLAAKQTDGSIRTFQGAYTVENGVIVQFNVQQIS